MQNDPYSILGVSRNAAASEIKSAYKTLVKKHHPDRGGSADKFNEIQEAYEILNDPSKKTQYDAYGSTNNQQYTGGGRGYQQQSFHGGFNFEDIFDFFSQDKRNTSHGSDLNIEISITLNDAYRGVKHNIEYHVEKICTICSGQGYKNANDVMHCTRCHGRGVEVQGILEMACRGCNGQGKIIKNPCHKCSGTGMYKTLNNVNINIPAGIKDSEIINMNGAGNGSGDLNVIVRIVSHSLFKRKDSHLYCTHSISCIEAMLGTEIRVHNILGKLITVKVLPSAQSGTEIKVINEGMPIRSTGRYGNLYIKLNISIPRLNDNQKKLLRENF